MNRPLWFKCPMGAWPSIAEVLMGLERRWTEDEVEADLAYFTMVGRVPGRRELAARWKWTEWEARCLMGSTEGPVHATSKQNPGYATSAGSVSSLPELSQSSPTALPLPSQGEQENLNNQPKSSHCSPTALPLPSQSSPSCARASSEEKEIEIRQASFEAATAFWGKRVNPKLNRRCSGGPSRSSADGKKLWKALEKNPEQVMKAFRWVAEGSDDFMRRKTQCIESVLRHRAKYADFWDEYGSSPDTTASGANKPSPAASWGHHPQPEIDEAANDAAYQQLLAIYGEDAVAK